MRIHVLSDLHIEFWKGGDIFNIPNTGADVIVLAGDIHIKNRAIDWIKSHFPPDRKVVYVFGNHEYYGGNYPQTLNKARILTKETPNIHILENDSLEIRDIVFLGTTLWTDLTLFGDFVTAGRAIMHRLSDFRRIRYGNNFKKFTPAIFTQLFSQAKEFLESKLQEFRDRKVVVITHHAPSMKSIDTIFQEDITSAGFASNLEDFICKNPNIKLWIHGHTHNFRDYNICNTRVVSNQFGYYDYEIVEDFLPDFVVDI